MDLPPPLPPYSIPAMISAQPAPFPEQIQRAHQFDTSHLSNTELLQHEAAVINWGASQARQGYCPANGVEPPVRPVFDIERPEGTLRFGVCASSLRTLPLALADGVTRLGRSTLQVAATAVTLPIDVLSLPAGLIRGNMR